MLRTWPLTAAVALLIAQPLSSQSPQERLAELEGRCADGRRTAKHAELITSYEELAKSLSDKDLQTARLRLTVLGEESELLGRLGTLDRLQDRRPQSLVRDLRRKTETGKDKFILARFCLLHELKKSAETELSNAVDLDPSLEADCARLLPQAREEKPPPGGYHRYRGHWLTNRHYERYRDFDEAYELLHAAAPTEFHLPFSPATKTPNAGTFEEKLGGQGKQWLRSAVTALRQDLQLDYRKTRHLLPSYAKDIGLRKDLLAKRKELKDQQVALRNRTQNYQKSQQPEVDALRKQAIAGFEEYRKLREQDLRTAKRLIRPAAIALIEQINRRESAIGSIGTYLSRHAGIGIGKTPITPLPGAEVTRRHLLEERQKSGIEDVLWLLLQLRAERHVEVITGSHRLLKNSLTPWEKLVAEDLLADAITAHNAIAAASLDDEERKLFELVNAYRRQAGRLPLEVDERLVVAARSHAHEMADKDYFGHISPLPRQRTPTDRARQMGFVGSIGENLAQTLSATAAFTNWLNTPVRHRNMLSDATCSGVGRSLDRSLWVCKFGSSDPSWRQIHRHLDTFQTRVARTAEELVRAMKDLSTGKADQEDVDAAQRRARAMLPFVLAPLSRQAFPACNPRHPAHSVESDLLAFIANAEVTAAWRTLQIAAIGRAIDVIRFDPILQHRQRALTIVDGAVGQTFGYRPESSSSGRDQEGARIEEHWRTVAMTAFRGDAKDDRTILDLLGRSANPRRKQTVAIRSAQERLGLARKFGGGAKTEQAVANGLAWLATVQDEDGAWRAQSFPKTSSSFNELGPGQLGVGNSEWEIAMTGLSLLAFSAAGHTPEHGEHAKTVAQGIRFLMGQMTGEGSFETNSTHYMYSQSIATQALCELYSATGDPHLGDNAQLALDYLTWAQDPVDGGWRYEPQQQGDASVTGWAILALSTGARVRLETAGFHGALNFMKLVTEPEARRIGYMGIATTVSHRLGAVGMLCWLFLGLDAEDPTIRLNAQRLLTNLPDRLRSKDFYYWYYATLAMFQVGGTAWQQWHDALLPALLEDQRDNKGTPLFGSWDPDSAYGRTGGRIYQTALGVLMLTTYYRYERGPRRHLVPFTGDLDACAAPFLQIIRERKDLRYRTIAERIMVDRFGSSMAPVLVRTLLRKDQPKEFRLRIIRLLEKIAGPEHEEMLLPLLSDPDFDLAGNISSLLDRVSSRKSIDQLIKHLEHRESVVRRNAVLALGRIAEPAAEAALRARQEKEKDRGCQQAIDAALAGLARRTTMAQIVSDALDDDDPARLETQETLAAILGADLPGHILEMKEREEDLYRKCKEAIQTHGSLAIVPLLLVILETDKLQIRVEALKRLRKITGKNNGFDPQAPSSQRRASVRQWLAWWRVHSREYTVH